MRDYTDSSFMHSLLDIDAPSLPTQTISPHLLNPPPINHTLKNT